PDRGGVPGDHALAYPLVGDRDVGVGRFPAQPFAQPGHQDHAGDDPPAVGLAFDLLGFLEDGVGDAPGEAVPVDPALRRRLQRHAGVTEGLDDVTLVDGVEAPEAVLVVAQDHLKPAGLRVGQHAAERLAALDLVPGDALVHVHQVVGDHIPVAPGV